MDELLVLFVILLCVFFGGGAVLGWVAAFRGASNRRATNKAVAELRAEVSELKLRLNELEPREAAEELPPAAPTAVEALADAARGRREPVAATVPPPMPPPLPSAKERPSIELTLGTKWVGWVGAIMFIIGIGLAVWYLYDVVENDAVRLAMGITVGVGAIVFGEVLLRKGYTAVFETLTGAGIAILYVCVFLSFKIWDLEVGAATAFGFAVLVTLLGIVMAVAHNALPIAVLSVLGGFLAPVLFSTGENHPHILFIYVGILDLVALGAAYYRRWRVLDIVSFAGTVILYQGWYAKFHDEDSLLPALLYTSIFYLMFLIIPTVYSLRNRKPLQPDALTLVIINAVHSLYAYYSVLYTDYRYVLGFVVLGQAVLVLLLFRAWSVRVVPTDQTARSLLIIALSLVTLAIPLELKLYGIPIAWAVEGAVVAYIGIRFNNRIVRFGGVAALGLSAAGLVYRLPLHRDPFTPVFNVPFGSWIVSIAAMFAASYLLFRAHKPDDREMRTLAGIAFMLGYAASCVVLSVELATHWHENWAPDHAGTWRTLQIDTLCLLWALIPAATLFAVERRKLPDAALVVPGIGFGIGTLIFLAGIDTTGSPSSVLFLNATFILRGAFIAAVLWAAFRCRRRGLPVPANVVETGGHVLLAILAVYEFDRWAHAAQRVTEAFALAMLSAVWAVHAFALVWHGLTSRLLLRRVLGMLLFGITILKVIFIDTQEMGRAFQVISFVASGVLLIAAAAFYQRFSAQFLHDEEKPHAPQ